MTTNLFAKNLIILLTSLLCFTTNAQNNSSQLAQHFIKDLSNKNIPLNAMIEKHTCAPHSDTAKEVILMQLESVRNMLLTQHKQPVIKPYNELTVEDKNLLLGENEQKDLFKVKCNGEFICWVWIKNNRVAAFASLNKGGKRILMPICR